MTPGTTYLDDPGRPVLRTRDRPSNMVLMAKDWEESLDTAVRGYVCLRGHRLRCGPAHVRHPLPGREPPRVYRVTHLDAAGARVDVVIRVSYGFDPGERDQVERETRVLERVGGVAGPSLYDFRLAKAWFETPVMCMQSCPREPTRTEFRRPNSYRAAWIGRGLDPWASSPGSGRVAGAERRDR